jgi:hypothetical protein
MRAGIEFVTKIRTHLQRSVLKAPTRVDDSSGAHPVEGEPSAFEQRRQEKDPSSPGHLDAPHYVEGAMLATADTYRLAQDVEWRCDTRVPFRLQRRRLATLTVQPNTPVVPWLVACLVLACVPVSPSLETMANPFTRLLCRYCRWLSCVEV